MRNVALLWASEKVNVRNTDGVNAESMGATSDTCVMGGYANNEAGAGRFDRSALALEHDAARSLK